jgi:hypothetical protein
MNDRRTEGEKRRRTLSSWLSISLAELKIDAELCAGRWRSAATINVDQFFKSYQN